MSNPTEIEACVYCGHITEDAPTHERFCALSIPCPQPFCCGKQVGRPCPVDVGFPAHPARTFSAHGGPA